MLVLSRKTGERIVIGHNMVITVMEVQGDRVKLGFTAPQEIPIVREELLGRTVPQAPVAGFSEEESSPFFAECA